MGLYLTSIAKTFLIVILLFLFEIKIFLEEFWTGVSPYTFGSLKLMFYAYKLTGNTKPIIIALTTTTIGSFLYYYVIRAVIRQGVSLKVLLFTAFMCWLFLVGLSSIIICIGDLTAGPVISDYAVKIVHEYEAKSNTQLSKLSKPYIHTSYNIIENYIETDDKNLAIALDGYDTIKLAITEPEKLNKKMYLVYDLAKKPKLLIIEPSMIKKYGKEATMREMHKLIVQYGTIILEIKEVAEKEKLKPITL